MNEAQLKPSSSVRSQPTIPRSEAEKRLVALFDEIHLELQESVGEIERLRQLVVEMPYLQSLIEKELPGVEERSSRLLGHLRAIEKAHTHLRQAG